MQKRVLIAIASVTAIFFFSGCTPSTVNITHAKPAATSDERGGEVTYVTVHLQTHQGRLGTPFNIENALYHLAKFAKERGYNYVAITKPKSIKQFMPDSIEALQECLDSTTVFGKCPGAKLVKHRGYSSTDYVLSAFLYKKQPYNVVTIPVDDILKTYAQYDLSKEGYEIKEKQLGRMVMTEDTL